MLWLCITLPRWPLEAQHCAQDERPTVITVCEGSTRSIVCCNPAAELAGLKPSMNFTTALAILPEVIAMERRLSAEQAALERLAAWAYQFSSNVILGEICTEPRRACTSSLWLEIGASLRLFGGFRQLVEQLEIELRKLFYSYQLGIAPTLEGAALLARTGVRIAITTLDALRARIAAVSVSWLNLEPWIPQQLHALGVRTVGLFTTLPRDGVAKRFGPEVCNHLDRLTGRAPDPRSAYRLPPKYCARFEFETEVRSTEALLFPLRRMLSEFVGFLRARDTGVQRFTLRFIHRETAATAIAVGLSMPDRSVEQFLSLTRERLEHAAPPAPTIALQLSADEFSMPTALHTDMLSGAAQQSEEFAHTMDRLAARLGEQQVHGLKAVADHRPEASWATAAAAAERPRRDFPDRPLWLLPQPRPLQLLQMDVPRGDFRWSRMLRAQDAQEQQGGLPALASGPERIESGWWDGGDVQRDYFVAHTQQGAALWIFKDLTDGSWHLHGFWS